MEIHFYPLDFDYQIRDGKPEILSFGKLDSGERICVIYQYQPYFYLRLKDLDKETIIPILEKLDIPSRDIPAKIISWEDAEKELLGKKEKFLKIFTNQPKAVPIIAKELQLLGMDCYEKDIPFIHRFLRDKEITPMALVTANGDYLKEKLNFRVPVFQAEDLKQFSKENVQHLRILSLDIETYAKEKIIEPKKNPILMIALYGIDEQNQEFKKVITWKKFNHQLDYLEIVQDEVAMLKQFRELMINYQPDIITGYFSDGFDLPYLKMRADLHKIKLDLGLDYSELDAGRETDFREGKSRIMGIPHLDVLKFVRNIFGKNMKTDSYTLDAVSEELLGHKKHDVDINNLAGVWDAHQDHQEELEDFCKYNLHDAHLNLQLCQKLLFDMIEFSKIVGLPIYEVIRMRFSRLVESYILKRAMEFNVIAPNRPSNQEVDQRFEETFQGAFVFEPKPGLYSDIVVFDFRSLYPSIITSHNIGPESFRCSCCKLKKEDYVPEEDDFWFCSKNKKFIPTVLEQLILVRSDLKKLIKEAKKNQEDTKMLEARSWAIKTLANSFYGYLGFFGARWYCLECAKSTTAYARHYIKSAIKKAEESGFKVVYSDTDSTFLLLGEKTLPEAMEFMKSVNKDLPSQMELEFENYYPKGLFVAAKGTEKGAKKRYALISKEGKMKITGFEVIRKNSSPIAREVQEKVLRDILENRTEEAIRYVKEIVKDLQDGKVPLRMLTIKTQITKEISEYSSISPHVAIARKLESMGEKIFPGRRIEYLIVRGKGLIRDKARLPNEVKEGEYDPEYYLKHQIMPALSGIFAVLGFKEEDLMEKSSQTGLGKFF